MDEVRGAAFGVGRLHSLYSLKTDQLVSHGIIDAKIKNEHILSGPSVTKLSSNSFYMFNTKTPFRYMNFFLLLLGWDLGVLAAENIEKNLLASGIDFLQNAIKIHEPHDEVNEVPKNDTFDLLDVARFNLTEAVGGLPRQIQYHDKLLVSCTSILFFSHQINFSFSVKTR